MLSILIPIYNFDVYALVHELHAQSIQSKINFEIIGLEDNSKATFRNEEIQQLDRVKYEKLPKNLGRAKIRNHLVSLAQYEYVLFLDCDCKLGSENFIKKYLEHLPLTGIISGGRQYAANRPDDPEFFLHWLYGTEKESRSLSERRNHKFKYFHSNNFMAEKKIFERLNFDENIDGYGYEDLVFAEDLRQQGINLEHIDNGVIHLGLENAEKFVQKTEKAIRNLIKIRRSGITIETNLENTYKRLNKFKLKKLYELSLRGQQKKLKSKLLGKSPSLYYLDLYKLNYYIAQLQI